MIRTAVIALTGAVIGCVVGYRLGQVRQALRLRQAVQTSTEPETAAEVIDDYAS